MTADDQTLAKIQKNHVFSAIKSQGLDPCEFVWDVDEYRPSGWYHSRKVSILAYAKNPAYYYRFGVAQNGYECERCPGRRQPRDSDYFLHWKEVGDDLYRWANRLKAELEAPDLWEEAHKHASSLPVILQFLSEGDTFTQEEAQKVITVIKETEKRISSEMDLTHRELVFIKDRLSYLESRAKEGYYKIDWVNLLFSTLVNVGVSLSLDPAKVSQIYSFFKEALSPVLGLSGV
jgi:hypothetical protein